MVGFLKTTLKVKYPNILTAKPYYFEETQESEDNKRCDNDDLSKLLIELAERCLQNNSDTIHLTLNTPKSNLHCYIKFSTEKKAESEG